jgi:hypothetical protein
MATIYPNQIPEYVVNSTRFQPLTVRSSGGGLTRYLLEYRTFTLSIRGHCVGETPPAFPVYNYIKLNFPTWFPADPPAYIDVGTTRVYVGAIAAALQPIDEVTSQSPLRFVHRETYTYYVATHTIEAG